MTAFDLYIILVSACLVACTLNKAYLPSYAVYMQWLFIAAIGNELAGEWLGKPLSNVLDHFYQPIEFALITLVYSRVLKNQRFQSWSKILIVVFAAAALSASFWIEDIYETNSISFNMGSIIIILYSVFYIIQLYESPPEMENLLAFPFFWINTANLFFYCGTFLQMGLDDYVKGFDPDLANRLQVINYVLNYVMYLFYLVGFLCQKIFT